MLHDFQACFFSLHNCATRKKPDAQSFTHGFDFELGHSIIGGLIVALSAGHKAIVRWHSYVYPIEMMICFTQPVNSKAKLEELTQLAHSRIIYSDRHMPYLSTIQHINLIGEHTGPDQSGVVYTWLSFKLEGRAQRMYKRDFQT